MSRDPRHRLAELLAERRKYREAATVYREISAQHADDPEAARKLADMLLLARAHREAIGAHIDLAARYRDAGSSVTALATYARAFKIAERYAPEEKELSRLVQGEMSELKREFEEVRAALADYDDAVRTLENNGRYEDAVALLDRMVALDRGNPLPYARFAETLIHLGHLDRALAAFREAIWALVRLRRFADGVRVAERLLHFRKSPEDAQLAAWLYVEAGGSQNGIFAISHLQTCFEATPDDLDMLTLLARAFTTAQHENKAIEVLKSLAVLAGEQGDLRLRAELVDYLGSVAPVDLQPAQAAIEAAPPSEGSAPVVSYRETMASITADKSAVEARSGSAPVTDELSEVSVLSEAFLEPILPREARRALEEAETFMRLKLYSKARYALERALAEDPYRVELREKLRAVLVAQKDHTALVNHTLELADQYSRRGYVERSRTLLEELLELVPSHEEARAMLSALRGESGARLPA